VQYQTHSPIGSSDPSHCGAPGIVTTLAGGNGQGLADGFGTSVKFNNGGIGHLKVDTSGNIFVAEYGNHMIRRVSPGGIVTSYQGAQYVNSVAVDSSGWVFIVWGQSNCWVSAARGPTGQLGWGGTWQVGSSDCSTKEYFLF
jgi:hypothetical protein